MFAAQKIVSSFLVLCLFFIPVAVHAAADEGVPVTSSNYKAPQHANYTLQNLLNAIICQIIGTNLVAGQLCTGFAKDGSLKLFTQVPGGGALGAVEAGVVALYINPPVNSSEYLAHVRSNLGFVQPVHAQVAGSGHGVLEPVIALWQVLRNIAYMLFIVVILVIGFMIMFRQKINPQTVISAQAALPGLIIGLVLVTFSYFISALIVDLSFLGVGLVVLLFAGLPNIITDPGSLAGSHNIFSLFQSYIWNNSLGDNIVSPVVKLILDPTVAATPISGNPLDNILDGSVLTKLAVRGLAWALGGILGVLLTTIILIALLIQMLRLFWALITAYITIMVVTITSPMIILASSFPGKGAILDVWWKTLLGNVLIFPAIFAAFLLSGMFLASVNPDDFKSTLPLFAGMPVSIIKAIIGYGIVLGTPAIPGMVKGALGVKDLGAFSQAAMGGAMAGFGAARGASQAGWKSAWGPTEEARQARLKKRAEIWAGTPGAAPGAVSRGMFRNLRNWYINRGT